MMSLTLSFCMTKTTSPSNSNKTTSFMKQPRNAFPHILCISESRNPSTSSYKKRSFASFVRITSPRSIVKLRIPTFVSVVITLIIIIASAINIDEPKYQKNLKWLGTALCIPQSSFNCSVHSVIGPYVWTAKSRVITVLESSSCILWSESPKGIFKLVKCSKKLMSTLIKRGNILPNPSM